MKYIYIIFFILLFSCKTSSKIKLKTSLSSESNVIGWYDSSTGKIWAISFPFEIHIKNHKENDYLINYKYEYKDSNMGKYAKLYFLNKSKIEPFKKNRIGINNKLLLYSKHIILNTNYSNRISSKVNKNTKDSILLGSFSSFKDLYPFLTSDLVRGDTLVLRFKSSKSNKKERIKVPISL